MKYWFLIFQTIENESCADLPNYKDKYGTTCKKMKEFGNCKDGKPGKISEQQLRVEANSDGVSPLDACCVCGGGQGWYYLWLNSSCNCLNLLYKRNYYRKSYFYCFYWSIDYYYFKS